MTRGVPGWGAHLTGPAPTTRFLEFMFEECGQCTPCLLAHLTSLICLKGPLEMEVVSGRTNVHADK